MILGTQINIHEKNEILGTQINVLDPPTVLHLRLWISGVGCLFKFWISGLGSRRILENIHQ